MAWTTLDMREDGDWFDEYVKSVVSHAQKPLPARSRRSGNLRISWYPVNDTQAVVEVEGEGTAEQKHLEAWAVREEVKAAGYEVPDHKLALRSISSWDDLISKAVRLLRSGNVTIGSNGWNYVEGTVVGDHGEYHTSIERNDPQSRAITMWTCECPWDQYAWGRTRQFKNMEGRPCSHVMALYFQSLATPVSDYDPQAHGPLPPGQKAAPAPGGPSPMDKLIPQVTLPQNTIEDPDAGVKQQDPATMGMTPQVPIPVGPGVPGTPGMGQVPMPPSNVAPFVQPPGYNPQQMQMFAPPATGQSQILPPFPMAQAFGDVGGTAQPTLPVSMPGGRPGPFPGNPLQQAFTFSKVTPVTAAEVTFQNSDMVRLNVAEMGVMQGPTPGANGDGQYRDIPVNSIGEVLGQDATTGWVDVIFPLHDSGPLEPFHVRAWIEPEKLSAMPNIKKPGPFVQRKSAEQPIMGWSNIAGEWIGLKDTHPIGSIWNGLNGPATVQDYSLNDEKAPLSVKDQNDAYYWAHPNDLSPYTINGHKANEHGHVAPGEVFHSQSGPTFKAVATDYDPNYGHGTFHAEVLDTAGSDHLVKGQIQTWDNGAAKNYTQNAWVPGPHPSYQPEDSAADQPKKNQKVPTDENGVPPKGTIFHTNNGYMFQSEGLANDGNFFATVLHGKYEKGVGKQISWSQWNAQDLALTGWIDGPMPGKEHLVPDPTQGDPYAPGTTHTYKSSDDPDHVLNGVPMTIVQKSEKYSQTPGFICKYVIPSSGQENTAWIPRSDLHPVQKHGYTPEEQEALKQQFPVGSTVEHSYGQKYEVAAHDFSNPTSPVAVHNPQSEGNYLFLQPSTLKHVPDPISEPMPSWAFEHLDEPQLSLPEAPQDEDDPETGPNWKNALQGGSEGGFRQEMLDSMYPIGSDWKYVGASVPGVNKGDTVKVQQTYYDNQPLYVFGPKGHATWTHPMNLKYLKQPEQPEEESKSFDPKLRSMPDFNPFDDAAVLRPGETYDPSYTKKWKGEDCDQCNNGVLEILCETCDGDGVIGDAQGDLFGHQQQTCPTCHGVGHTLHACAKCDGTGNMWHTKQMGFEGEGFQDPTPPWMTEDGDPGIQQGFIRCPKCKNDPDEKYNCHECNGRGKKLAFYHHHPEISVSNGWMLGSESYADTLDGHHDYVWKDYQSGSWINNHLRGKANYTPDSDVHDYVEAMDEVMDEHPGMNVPSILYRGTNWSKYLTLAAEDQKGLSTSEASNNKNWIGCKVTEDGYMSASVERGTAEGFGSMAVLHCPEGTKGFYMPTHHHNEAEWLLPRGSIWECIGVEDGRPQLKLVGYSHKSGNHNLDR